MVKYYIIHPNGRSRLKAKTDAEAVEAFNNHYALASRWVSPKPKATLVKQEDVVMGSVDLEVSGFAPYATPPKLVLDDADTK